jgi:hypothetical protein
MTNEGREGRKPMQETYIATVSVYVIGPKFEVMREIEKVITANIENENFAHAMDKDEEYNLKVVARHASSPLPKPLRSSG